MISIGQSPEIPFVETVMNESGESQIFWTPDGKILPSLLYKFFEENRIGLFYAKGADIKNSNPVVVKIIGNLVFEVNETYLLQTAKNFIIKKTEEAGNSDPIIDSLHTSTGLFSTKNQKLLSQVNLDFIEDTNNSAVLFFKNCVVEIKQDGISLKSYSDFDGYVWGKNIIPHDFTSISFESLNAGCNFLHFLKDITQVDDPTESENRFASLFSIIGYLSHRYKDPTKTKAIVFMDASPSGQPNGRTGKTLICIAIGKLRNLAVLDGKSYDQRRWFRFSGISFGTDLLLFDDIQKNFDMELLFPLMTTGMPIQRKYKDDIFIPYAESPKVAITTNYALNGDGSSFKARVFEFEISNTFNADYQPTDKYGKRFFDDWNEHEWNLFYNLIAHAVKFYLRKGLVSSEPINLKLSKLVHQTNEDFIDFCRRYIEPDVRYDKQDLFNRFKKEFADNSALSQRTFTDWLKRWGNYIGAKVVEGHSGDTRHICFIVGTNS